MTEALPPKDDYNNFDPVDLGHAVAWLLKHAKVRGADDDAGRRGDLLLARRYLGMIESHINALERGKAMP